MQFHFFCKIALAQTTHLTKLNVCIYFLRQSVEEGAKTREAL